MLSSVSSTPSTFPCFNLTVQLIINDSLKHAEHFNHLIGKMSKLVSHFRSSTVASDLFDGHL